MPSFPELTGARDALRQHQARLADWAQLGRYRDANRKVRPPTTSESRVVFMGDSITDIWQDPQYGFFAARGEYVNRGIGGQTTPQMLVRFRPDVIDLEPRVVVILAGTNDIAGNTGPSTDDEIAGNIASMCELAHAHGIRVVLASVLPVSDYHDRADDDVPVQTTERPMDRIRALNQRLRAYAAAHGHVYLDYFTAVADDRGLLRRDLSEDDLHPNAKGYAIMGPLAEAAVARALQ